MKAELGFEFGTTRAQSQAFPSVPQLSPVGHVRLLGGAPLFLSVSAGVWQENRNHGRISSEEI